MARIARKTRRQQRRRFADDVQLLVAPVGVRTPKNPSGGRSPNNSAPKGSPGGVPTQSGGTSGDLTIDDYQGKTPVVPYTGPPLTPGNHVGRRRSRPSLVSLLPPEVPSAPLAPLAAQIGAAAANPLQTLLQGLRGPLAASAAPSKPSDDYYEPFTDEQLHPTNPQAAKPAVGNFGLSSTSNPELFKAFQDLRDDPASRHNPRAQRNLRAAREVLNTQAARPLPVAAPPKAAATNAADPLGAKTPGAASLEEIMAAQQAGTLKVDAQGRLTIPAERQAIRRLRRAQQAFDQGTGITTGLGPNADAFADALAAYGDYDPQGIGAWVKSEGGAYENGGEAGPQNWLGIGYPGHQTPFAVSPYFSGSPERAGRAAGEWIDGLIGSDFDYGAAPSLQSAIQSAKGGSAEDLIAGLAASGWGTNVAHVQQNLSGVSVQHDPQAAANLKAAKANAREVGINPTMFNGDVAGGEGDFTWVRADAKGMVDWVRSALGTDEGTAEAERWGARFGLNTVSQPWCANFVSNGLLRRGIVDLPSNPNYVPSYEQEWAQYAVPGGLENAKPGDLITYSGEHIAVYTGNGKAIGGNQSDSVTEGDAASLSSHPISMVIRPPYKGGKVKVADSQLAGSSMESALGGVGGGEAVTGAAGEAVGAPGGDAAIGAAEVAPLVQLLNPLPVSAPSPLSALPGEESLSGSPITELEALLSRRQR